MDSSSYSSRDFPRTQDRLSQVQGKLQQQKLRYQSLRYRQTSSHQDFYQLKHQFQYSLNKLNSLSTRQVGIKQAKAIIDKNITQRALKCFLSCLGQIQKLQSPGAKQKDLQILAYISQKFGQKLIQNSQTPFKTIQKMLEICSQFFKDSTRQVHEAAASTWSSIYLNVFPQGNLDVFFQIFYQPLQLLLVSGVNTKARSAASIGIFQLVVSQYNSDFYDVLKLILNRLIPLFLRVKAEYPDLISALGVLIQTLGISQITPDLDFLFKKLVLYLDTKAGHPSKIQACKLLKCLAKKMQMVADVILEPAHSEVVQTLYRVRTDKVAGVQTAARQAYNMWKVLISIQKSIQQQKMQKQPIGVDEVQWYRTQIENPYQTNNFRTIRELSKKNQEKKGVLSNWGSQKQVPKQEISKPKIEKHQKQPPKAGVNTHIMQVINRQTQVDQTLQLSDYSHLTSPPKQAKVDLSQTFSNMQQAMQRGFGSISQRLEKLDHRLDDAYEKLDNISFQQRKSEIRPPQSSQTPPNFKQRTELDILSKIWVDALEDLLQGEIESAFKKVLESGDDIYLLRLMHLTGPCINSLQANTVGEVLERIALIMNSEFIDGLGVDWVTDALQSNSLECLDVEEREELKQAMFKVGNVSEEYSEQALNLSMQIN